MMISKLWRLTDANCKLVDFSNHHGQSLLSAPNTPIVFWPDTTVCWPVTIWLTEKSQSYHSRSSKKGIRNSNGGSVVTQASVISHFVRYVFNVNRKLFVTLNDDHIKNWVKTLAEEDDPKDPLTKRRKNTQIGKIMRAGLRFLIWYQKVMLDHDRHGKIIIN